MEPEQFLKCTDKNINNSNIYIYVNLKHVLVTYFYSGLDTCKNFQFDIDKVFYLTKITENSVKNISPNLKCYNCKSIYIVLFVYGDKKTFNNSNILSYINVYFFLKSVIILMYYLQLVHFLF